MSSSLLRAPEADYRINDLVSGASHGHPMVDTRTTGVDSDENKYQRKSFLEYARRWFRQVNGIY